MAPREAEPPFPIEGPASVGPHESNGWRGGIRTHRDVSLPINNRVPYRFGAPAKTWWPTAESNRALRLFRPALYRQSSLAERFPRADSNRDDEIQCLASCLWTTGECEWFREKESNLQPPGSEPGVLSIELSLSMG
jgi:hypothetical protein